MRGGLGIVAVPVPGSCINIKRRKEIILSAFSCMDSAVPEGRTIYSKVCSLYPIRTRAGRVVLPVRRVP